MAVEAEKMREKQREQRERIKAEQVSGMMGNTIKVLKFCPLLV